MAEALAILREDAKKFLEWLRAHEKAENRSGARTLPPPPEIPTLT
jgi:hypothetical protein